MVGGKGQRKLDSGLRLTVDKLLNVLGCFVIWETLYLVRRRNQELECVVPKASITTTRHFCFFVSLTHANKESQALQDLHSLNRWIF
jgi:hypothetical protein